MLLTVSLLLGHTQRLFFPGARTTGNEFLVSTEAPGSTFRQRQCRSRQLALIPVLMEDPDVGIGIQLDRANFKAQTMGRVVHSPEKPFKQRSAKAGNRSWRDCVTALLT